MISSIDTAKNAFIKIPNKLSQNAFKIVKCMQNDLLRYSNMAMMTVRNIPDEVHRSLRARASKHGRSTEAEVRAILEDSVKVEGRIKLGSMLANIGQQAELNDDELAQIEQTRDKKTAQPVGFE